MDIYQEEILEHYRHPRNKGVIDAADVVQNENNPTCGDKIALYLKFSDDKVVDVKFEGEGCAISVASASMLTEEIEGLSLDDIRKLDKDDILEMLGIELGPTRLKCALLSLQAVSNAVTKK